MAERFFNAQLTVPEVVSQLEAKHRSTNKIQPNYETIRKVAKSVRGIILDGGHTSILLRAGLLPVNEAAIVPSEFGEQFPFACLQPKTVLGILQDSKIEISRKTQLLKAIRSQATAELASASGIKQNEEMERTLPNATRIPEEEKTMYINNVRSNAKALRNLIRITEGLATNPDYQELQEIAQTVGKIDMILPPLK